jgi:hypothetical protein
MNTFTKEPLLATEIHAPYFVAFTVSNTKGEMIRLCKRFILKHKIWYCILDSEVKLFDVMKKAGVLPDLAEVIKKTKDGHLCRLKVIQNSQVGKTSDVKTRTG